MIEKEPLFYTRFRARGTATRAGALSSPLDLLLTDLSLRILGQVMAVRPS